MMKKILSKFAPFILLFLVSCGGDGQEQPIMDSTLPEPLSKTEEQAPDRVPITTRKLIKDGEIEFETKDLQKTAAFITGVVQDANGYLTNESTNAYPDRQEHRMTLRIPAEKFDLVLQKISEEAGRLDRKTVNVQDVSEEYVDIAARVKTKKELAERYRQLLQQAKQVDEMLQIEREMANLQADIESIEGRLKFLDERVTMSTLTVIAYVQKSSAFGFSSRALHAIQNGWDGFLFFVLGLINLWVFIVTGVLLYILLRRWKSNKNRKKEEGVV